MKFYVRDWVSDDGVQVCSLAARGLWMEMLCRMWQHGGRLLRPSGEPIRTAEDIARYVAGREPLESVRSALAELDSEGVFSRDEDGVIVSRRQLRDLRKRDEFKALADRRWSKQISGKAAKVLNTSRIAARDSDAMRALDASPGNGNGSGNDNGNDLSLLSCPSLLESGSGSESKGSAKAKTRSVKPMGPASPTVLEFPCTGLGPSTWALTENHLAELSSAYDTLDVLAELKKLRQRCLANPAEKKTHRGYPMRVVNWLNRAVDWLRTTPTTSRAQQRPSKEDALMQAAVEEHQRELRLDCESEDSPMSGALRIGPKQRGSYVARGGDA